MLGNYFFHTRSECRPVWIQMSVLIWVQTVCKACTDQELSGGWGAGPLARKQPAWTMFFLVRSLFYRGGPMVLLQRKLYFLKDPEGFNIFQRGGPTFSRGGGGFLISIEAHMTCDFLEGVWTPYPHPLWIHTWKGYGEYMNTMHRSNRGCQKSLIIKILSPIISNRKDVL